MSDLLHAHLAIVSRRDLRLARRLDLPAATDGFGSAEGQPARRVGLAWRPASVSEAVARGLVAEVPAEGDLLILGAGVGTLTRAALDRWPRRRIVLLEPDPMQLRLALSQTDVSAELDAGRLVLRLASDLIALSPWAGPILTHPLAAELHTRELRFLRRPAEHPVALIRHGALFVDDLIDELEERGLRVAPLAFERLAEEEVQRFVTLAQPHSLWSVNVSTDLCDFAAARGLPLFIWEIDPTLLRPSPPKRPQPHTILCTWRQAHVATWSRAGFPHVMHLPLAANPRRRQPAAPDTLEPHERPPVSFVGASMAETAQKWSRAAARALSEHAGIDPTVAGTLLGQLMELQRREPSRFVLPELLDRVAPGFRHRPGPLDPLLMVGEWAAAERRLNLVARLGPLGVRVWGDAGWAQLSGKGVDWQGMLSHHAPLSRVYSGSTVNVDLGRLYQLDIVTMRVFDVLACGGCLLAERSPALAALFTEGEHLDGWSSPDELVAKTARWLADPAGARALGARGRAHVLAHHTVGHRVDAMLSFAQARGLRLDP